MNAESQMSTAPSISGNLIGNACLIPGFARLTTVRSVAFLIVGMLICTGVCAEERPSPPVSPMFVGTNMGSAELEMAYWECDYDVTISGLGLAEGALCGEIYEELKKRRFGGDFPALLRWWQQNKIAEHEAIRRKRAAQASANGGEEF